MCVGCGEGWAKRVSGSRRCSASGIAFGARSIEAAGNSWIALLMHGERRSAPVEGVAGLSTGYLTGVGLCQFLGFSFTVGLTSKICNLQSPQ